MRLLTSNTDYISINYLLNASFMSVYEVVLLISLRVTLKGFDKIILRLLGYLKKTFSLRFYQKCLIFLRFLEDFFLMVRDAAKSFINTVAFISIDNSLNTWKNSLGCFSSLLKFYGYFRIVWIFVSILCDTSRRAIRMC